ncbi:hypothetical protein DFR70_104148 [Nocardia tenerifensis]|uniref:Uncharacterized protein n=1 Tax=Nocardia tenerifensis TaxID=228006 RepID=A0A318KQ84_9NOCA|nr:hypothetical protein DFR70_104148 [Nocardia tenerifensis]
MIAEYSEVQRLLDEAVRDRRLPGVVSEIRDVSEADQT